MTLGVSGAVAIIAIWIITAVIVLAEKVPLIGMIVALVAALIATALIACN